MWLTTTAGFLSAVARYNDADHLTVRGRDYQSMKYLVDQLNEMKDNNFELTESYDETAITREDKKDYRYRVVVHRNDFASFAAYEVLTYVVYHNFKDAATKQRGDVYHETLMSVWLNMRNLTKEEDGELPKPKALLSGKSFVNRNSAWWSAEDYVDHFEKRAADYAEDPDLPDGFEDPDIDLNSMTDEEFANWEQMSEDEFAAWLKDQQHS